MAKALLLFESNPASPEQVDDYHAWHESTHIQMQPPPVQRNSTSVSEATA